MERSERIQEKGQNEIEELKVVVRSQSKEQIKDDFLKEESAATKLKRKIDIEVAKKQEAPGDFEGDAKDKLSDKGIAVDVRTQVIKILLAADPNIDKIPEVTGFSKIIIQKISEKIKPEETYLQEAPYLYNIFQKTIQGNITDIDILAEEFHELKALQVFNPLMYKKLEEVMMAVAIDQGYKQDEIEEKFEIENSSNNKSNGSSLDYEFKRDWETLSTFNFSNEDKKLIRSLYSPKDFADYLVSVKKDIQAENKEDNKHINEDINEETERRIVMVFSKLYAKADTEAASKFFDEIIKEGFLNSIELSQILLSRRLYNLRNQFASLSPTEYNKLPEEFKSLKFFTGKTFRESVDKKMKVKLIVKNEKGNDEEIENLVPEVKTLPFVTNEEISIDKFLMDIETEVGHEIETRKFCHNISALVMRSPDAEKGFWSQIAHYADELRATDIDNINILPDSDAISSAFSLYTKNIWEAFGENNWIHDPNIFQSMDRGNFNRLQQTTIKQLKEMFPNYDDWRLYRAMKIGIGLAQGVYITEQEAAAWADPQMQQTGDVTFRSYYYNDNSALNALNPTHTLLRFFTEKTSKGPILFSLVTGIDQKLFRVYDHRELWLKLQEFKDAFKSGTTSFERKNPFERTLMEILPNIARIGSVITRRGWGLRPALEGWYVYKKEGENETGNIDYLATFKSLQYIGIEAVYQYLNDVLEEDPDFNKLLIYDLEHIKKERLIQIENEVEKDIKDKKINENINKEDEIQKRFIKGKTDRDEFFKYLYKQYICNDENLANKPITDLEVNKAYEQYLATVKIEAINDVNNLLKRAGKEASISRRYNAIDKKVRDELIEKEIYKKLLSRTLTGMIRDRTPSKLVLYDRKRLSEKGLSNWENLRMKCEWKGSEGRRIMDQAMKDLQFLETKARSETTKRMKEYLQKKGITERTSYSEITFKDFETDEKKYLINEDFIRNNIEDETRQKNVIKLFSAIKTQCNNENGLFTKKFSELLREKDVLGNFIEKYFPFAIVPEELEKSFLAFKNTGEKVLKRRHGDISGAEMIVFKNINDLLNSLHEVAISPDRKMDKLVQQIGNIEAYIEGTIGKKEALRVAYQLSVMVINYFKKDTIARNILTKYLISGDYHSLAARFAGQNKGVWEWEAREIDQFINELERLRILPTEPIDLSRVKYERKKPLKLFGISFGKEKIIVNPSNLIEKPIKLFGLKVGSIKQIKGDYEYYSGKLRRENGAATSNLFFEVVNRYLPVFLIFVLYQFIKKSFEKRK